MPMKKIVAILSLLIISIYVAFLLAMPYFRSLRAFKKAFTTLIKNNNARRIEKMKPNPQSVIGEISHSFRCEYSDPTVADVFSNFNMRMSDRFVKIYIEGFLKKKVQDESVWTHYWQYQDEIILTFKMIVFCGSFVWKIQREDGEESCEMTLDSKVIEDRIEIVQEDVNFYTSKSGI